MRKSRSKERGAKHRVALLAFFIGVGVGVSALAGGLYGFRGLRADFSLSGGAPGAVRSYLTDLAAGRVKAAESLAVGQALSALHLNTAHRTLDPAPVLGLRILPEEEGRRVGLYGVAAETGGAHPTIEQYQVLALSTAHGWRVADVWEGPAPTDFGGVATDGAILNTAKAWLHDEASGSAQASLDELAGGALASAEQTSASGKTWGKSVTIGAPRWHVLAVSGDWGAIEGQWDATTPSGKTQVELVLLGQAVDGRWRITRAVTIR